MKMSKKIKAAITVAAIAGTCALASPSFAAWTSDAPSKLDADIFASANGGSEGLMTVGSAGKVFYMADPAAESPSWTQVYPPTTDDLVAVIADDPGNPANNDFVVFTDRGWVYSAATADGAWTDISTPLYSIHNGDHVAGAAALANDKYIVVAVNGKVSLKADADSSWSPNMSVLAGKDLATNGIKGVVVYDAEHVLVYGHSASDGSGKNLLKLKVSEALGSWSVAAEYKVANCNNINSVAVTSSGVFVAGEQGKVVRLSSDLSDCDIAVALTASDTSPSGTDVFNAIAYDTTEKCGYVSGNAGKLYKINLEDPTHKLVEVANTGTTKNLNTSTLISGASRVYASGADGTSIYKDSSYWKDVSSVTNAPNAKSVVTNGNPDVNSGVPTRFYIAADDDKLWSSTDPESEWEDLSTGAYTMGTAISGTTSVYGTKSGSEYVATIGDPGKIAVYTIGGAAKEFVAAGVKSLVVFDEGIIAGAADNVTFFNFTADSGATGSSMTTPPTGTLDHLCGTKKGLYYVDSTAGNIYAMSFSGTGLTDAFDTGCSWVKASKLMTDLGTAGMGISQVKLYSLTDGTMVAAGGAGQGICLVTDDLGADIAADITATTMNFPASETAAIIGISGTSTDMVVSTEDNVWRYTDSGGWVKYGSLSNVAAGYTATGVASIGGKVLSIDADQLAYSTGTDFSPVSSGDFPIGANITSAFNATKDYVYVGGQEGLMYRGHKIGETDINWGYRYSDRFFGAKDFKKITGAGEKVFAAYGTNNAELAWKDNSAWKWTALTVDSNSDNIDSLNLNDLHAGDENTLFIAHAGGSGISALLKGTVDGASGKVLFKYQGTGGGIAMPDSFTALSVLDDSTIYGISGHSLYKLDSPVGVNWTITGLGLLDPQTLNDVVALSNDKVYVVGNNGYAASYDGRETSNLPAITGNPDLISCWACSGYLYATDASGKVHTYNAETNAWTSENVAEGKALLDITGSVKGKYLLAVGADGVSYVTEIGSDDSGGAQSDTYVTKIEGDTAVVNSEVPKRIEPETLASTYNTPPEMAVVCDVQEFTTTGGVADGSTHTFTFNFTPTSDYAFNDVVLYKLKSDGTNLTYNRVSAAPASPTSGDFWITTAGGDAVGAGDTLTSGTAYSVFFTIEDGSQYDNDSTPGKITDPAVLGTSSGGSASGCVFNPVQSFGMEWLMLAFAPIAAFFRSRFKK